MKSVCTHYSNQTWTEVKVKTSSGKVYNVKAHTEIFTDKTNPFIMEDKLYIEFAANGRNLRIADDEIIFQATEYLQNEIQLLTL